MLLDQAGFFPARRALDTILQIFINKDGNFRKQFQSIEFNQRFWELLLYKTFTDNFEVVNSTHESPDFELRKDGEKVFIEADLQIQQKMIEYTINYCYKRFS